MAKVCVAARAAGGAAVVALVGTATGVAVDEEAAAISGSTAGTAAELFLDTDAKRSLRKLSLLLPFNKFFSE